MARRGKRTQQPRSQLNIQGQLLAISQQMQASRDRNLMNAWSEGGTFQGQKVTDDFVLNYWKQRESKLDPRDPQYDATKNNIFQLQYGIAQSKEELLYKQGKIGESTFGKFYLNWAKKIPKGSEFWRTLQKNAASFLEAAKEKGRRAGEAAKVKSYDAYKQKQYDELINIGDYMDAAVKQLAKDLGYNLQTQGDEVTAALTTDLKAHPERYNLLLNALAKGDPGWDGQVTSAYYSSALHNAEQGWGNIANRAKKDGYASDYQKAAGYQGDLATAAIDSNTWPVSESYAAARAKLDSVWNDPNTTQMDKQAAAEQFASTLDTLSKDPNIGTDTSTMLANDATAWRGGEVQDGPSFGEALIGVSLPGVPKGASENQFVTQSVALYTATRQAQQADPAGWVYAPATTDATGQPIFDAEGKSPIGLVPSSTVPAGSAAITLPTLNGDVVTAFVAVNDIKVTNPDDPKGAGEIIGRVAHYQIGGQTVTIYGFTDSAGRQRWSSRAPWADGVTQTLDKNGDVVVTPPPIGATALDVAKALDTAYGTNLTSLLSSGANKTESAPVFKYQGTGETKTISSRQTIKFEDGKFKLETTNYTTVDGKSVDNGSTENDLGASGTPYTAETLKTSVISPTRDVAPVPSIDFSTLLQASASASELYISSSALQQISSDPVFQAMFLNQIKAATGATNDLDPQVIQAWDSLIADLGSNSTKLPMAEARMAQHRTDLEFPGVDKVGHEGSLSITFGSGQTLKLPNLPSYAGQQQVDQTVRPAQGDNEKFTAPSPTPTPVAPAVAPAPAPTPLPTVAPQPAPAPTPIAPLPTTTRVDQGRYAGKIIPL